MKLSGQPLPKRPTSFSDLLEIVCRGTHCQRLLKTARNTGFLTNGVFMFEMEAESEKQEVERMHWDAIATDSIYDKAESLSIKAALPKSLSVEATKARFLGPLNKDNENSPLVVLINGENRRAFVELGAFKALWERYPTQSWYFSRLVNGPIVILDNSDFMAGTFKGMVAPIPIKEDSELQDTTFVRKWRDGRWKYESVKG